MVGRAGLSVALWDNRNRMLPLPSGALLCLLWAGGHMDAVLPGSLGLVQSSLYTEVCP